MIRAAGLETASSPDPTPYCRSLQGRTTLNEVEQPELHMVDAAGFVHWIDEAISVYAVAMRAPSEQLPGRRAIANQHTSHDGFRCLLAVENGELVGFGYGFRGETGQWWHDIVMEMLVSTLGAEKAKRWFDDPFEIAEVHVRPNHQGRGTGRRILTALCAGRTERTAVLSTQDVKSRARGLYRSLGFVDLLTDFRFPGSDQAYAVMGCSLPLA